MLFPVNSTNLKNLSVGELARPSISRAKEFRSHAPTTAEVRGVLCGRASSAQMNSDTQEKPHGPVLLTAPLNQRQPRAGRGFKSQMCLDEKERRFSRSFLFPPHTPPPTLLSLPALFFALLLVPRLVEVRQTFPSSSLAAVAMVVSAPPNYLGWYFHGHGSGWHRARRCGREAVHRCQQFCVPETDLRRQEEEEEEEDEEED